LHKESSHKLVCVSHYRIYSRISRKIYDHILIKK